MTSGSRVGDARVATRNGSERHMRSDMELATERFRSRAAEAQTTVHEAADWREVVELALALAGDEPVAVAPGLAAEVPLVLELLGGRALLPDPREPARSVADAAVGLVRGEFAVAETGSVLVVQDALPDRTVSMLSRALVQVVDRDHVVDGLDDVAVWLAQRAAAPGYVALVTGPSRTADIERSLTIGVQGPGAVHVVLLG